MRKSYSHFFSKKLQHICVSLNVNFNESLTNDVVSFEQLGPDWQIANTLICIAPDKKGYQESTFFLFLHENMCHGYSLEAPH